jgi:hypothetical protein
MDQQKCSPKRAISLHMEACRAGHCPHASVCYHLAKNIRNSELDYLTTIDKAIETGHDVHLALCSPLTQPIEERLEHHENFSVTISCRDAYENKAVNRFPQQVQISVYSEENCKRWTNFQKIYLIKSLSTFNTFTSLLGKSHLGRLHFAIDQKWLDKDILLEIIRYFEMYGNEKNSLDSCLTSYVLNGECYCHSGNYIDITYDGTVRTCPFSKDGVALPDNYDMNELFGLKQLPHRCKYMEIFGGKDERKLRATSNPDHRTDHRIQAYAKHQRRLSLRSKGCD